MPEVVSLAQYLRDRRRAAKVRHNEAVARALRMRELTDQSERRMAARNRRHQMSLGSGSTRQAALREPGTTSS
jgi:hypothetical protein